MSVESHSWRVVHSDADRLDFAGQVELIEEVHLCIFAMRELTQGMKLIRSFPLLFVAGVLETLFEFEQNELMRFFRRVDQLGSDEVEEVIEVEVDCMVVDILCLRCSFYFEVVKESEEVNHELKTNQLLNDQWFFEHSWILQLESIFLFDSIDYVEVLKHNVFEELFALFHLRSELFVFLQQVVMVLETQLDEDDEV